VFNQVPSNDNNNLNQSSLIEPAVLPFAIPAIPTTFNMQFPIHQPPCDPQMMHNIHPHIAIENAASTADNQSNRKATNNTEDSATSSSNAPLLLPSVAKKRTFVVKPRFVLKLMEVLSMEECQSAIQWMPEGNSFCILDAEDLVENVLAEHFKKIKYSSFVRARDFVDMNYDHLNVKLTMFLVFSSSADSKAQ
jgi:hypothetical protein